VAVPGGETGAELARRLVEARLAACVTRLPGAHSTYRWEGVVETAAEELLLIKTTAAAYGAVEAALREHHPYDVPEILALPVAAGLSDYLRWLGDQVVVPGEAS
jgi:periplasmic divalent cation tolerance protein